MRDSPSHSLEPTMRQINALLLVSLFFTYSAGVALAEKGTALKPTLTKPGEAVHEEAFGGAELGKSWHVAKGDWKPQEGVLIGKEKASDMHAAVLTLQYPH